jgi:O-antigen ligase
MIKSKTIWLICLGIITTALPLLNNGSFGIHLFDGKRLAIIATVIGAMYCLFRYPITLSDKQQLHYCLVLGTLLTISIGLAEKPLMASLETASMVGLTLSAIVFSRLANAPLQALRIATVAAALYLLMATAHLGNSYVLQLSEQVVARLPGFNNIREFSHWLTWTLPLVGALPFYRRFLTKVPGYWLWMIAIGWWFLFYIAAGRGSAVATLLAVAIVTCLYQRRALTWLKTLVTAAIIGNTMGYLWIGLEAQYAPSILHIDGGLLSNQSSDRLSLWTETWDMFVAHPWFGVGPMHFAHHTTSEFASPHNIVLLQLAETGIFATLLVFSGLAYAYLKLLFQARQQPDNILLMGFSTAVIAAGIHSLFSGVQLAPYSQFWLIIIVGATIHLCRARQTNPTGPETHTLTGTRILACGVAAMLLIGLALVVIDPNLPDPWANIIGGRQPRFWSHGQF